MENWKTKAHGNIIWKKIRKNCTEIGDNLEVFQKIWTLTLKLLCKIPNEAIVKSLGSVLLLHMKPQKNVWQATHQLERTTGVKC